MFTMLHNSKLLLQSQFIHSHTPTPSSPILTQHCKLSRRELALSANTSLLLLVGSQTLEPFNISKARADDTTSTHACYSETTPTKRAFLDISIDREPKGRIIVGLYQDDVPAGAARFSDLVTGAAGITYRRKEFVKLTPNFLQHSGVRSYGIDADLAKRTGRTLEAGNLITEWENVNRKCPGTKNLAGTIGIIVRDPLKAAPKQKLVAKGGKFEVTEEEVGTDPNGTEFVISMRDSPELDASTLVIGRVLEGMDVVDMIGQVKTVQENTSSSFFKVAKLIGDKRAVVAERGFNRPYSKVVVTNCGLLID